MSTINVKMHPSGEGVKEWRDILNSRERILDCSSVCTVTVWSAIGETISSSRRPQYWHTYKGWLDTLDTVMSSVLDWSTFCTMTTFLSQSPSLTSSAAAKDQGTRHNRIFKRGFLTNTPFSWAYYSASPPLTSSPAAPQGHVACGTKAESSPHAAHHDLKSEWRSSEGWVTILMAVVCGGAWWCGGRRKVAWQACHHATHLATQWNCLILAFPDDAQLAGLCFRVLYAVYWCVSGRRLPHCVFKVSRVTLAKAGVITRFRPYSETLQRYTSTVSKDSCLSDTSF